MGMFDFLKAYKVMKSKDFVEAKKALDDLKVITAYNRPVDNQAFIQQGGKYGYDSHTVKSYDLYEMAMYSDILQNVLSTLKNEIFRNGFDIIDNFSYVDYEQRNKVEKLLNRINFNNQSLTDVLEEIENDLNILDNAYLLVIKSYLENFDNEIVGGEVEEVIRLDPLSVELMHDNKSRLGYDLEGLPIYFDPENREQLTHSAINKNGRKNLRACYKVNVYSTTTNGTSQGSMYYEDSELLHLSKYKPSKLYGFSPLYSLYNKVMTLINMDTYMRQYYSGNKVPKGLLTVNTQNAKSFWTFWDSFIEKLRKDPHIVHPLIHQSGEGKEPIKWIDFMKNLQEMQYIEVRNEIRAQIGAVFGVSPIFTNDVSTGGGLNNEGLQITVTDRAVEFGQNIHNNKTLPWLIEQFGLTTIKLTLKPSKEVDEVAEKDLRLKELQIAKATAELGITTTMNDNGEFSYKPGKVEIQEQQNAGFPVMEKALEVKKNIKPTKAQVKEVESAMMNELDKILKQFNLKTKPSKEELKLMVNKATKDLDKALKTKNANKIKAIYQKAAKDTGKQLNQKFSLNEKDKNIIESLKKSPVYQKAFSGLSKNISDKLKDAIIKTYDSKDGISLDKIKDNMREVIDASESKLETIARTESTKISVAARKTQYDKTGAEYKYYHVGPSDSRTSQMSKEMKKLSKNGLTWDEYLNTMKKVVSKYNPGWDINIQAPITHPNTRHVFIAKRVEE